MDRHAQKSCGWGGPLIGLGQIQLTAYRTLESSLRASSGSSSEIVSAAARAILAIVDELYVLTGTPKQFLGRIRLILEKTLNSLTDIVTSLKPSIGKQTDPINEAILNLASSLGKVIDNTLNI